MLIPKDFTVDNLTLVSVSAENIDTFREYCHGLKPYGITFP